MVDNKDNDEYEFADLDVMSPDSMGEDETHPHSDKSSEQPREAGKKDVKRNALIVVVLVVIAMLLYKFLGSFFSKKTEPVKPEVTPPVTVSQPVTPPVVQTPKPVVVEQTPPVAPAATQPVSQPVENPVLNQKIASMELNQQTLRSDVNNLGSQLNSINSSITDLNTKIANLGQMVTTLSNTVEQQSIQITRLVEVQAKKITIIKRHKMAHSPVYFIQAVIPGRAWLIATNGSTLTVREGTKVAGYGIVKLIDPVQGRVLMSSGRVIRFSQQDS